MNKSLVLLLICIFICGALCGIQMERLFGESTCEDTQTEIVDELPATPIKPQILVIEKPVDRVVYIEAEAENETELSAEDIELIAKVVHREAENQDMIGKRLVVDTILNRYYSDAHPNTIDGVIYEDNQYYKRGDLDNTQFDSIDLLAVYKEMAERIDTDVMYYRTEHYHTFGVPLYPHGDHYFSGRAKE